MVHSPSLARTLSGSTSLVGVIGWPVGHSISPPMHNAAFRALELNWIYLPLAVRPDDLSKAVSGLQALGFAGFNATIPHKIALCSLVSLSPEASAIGAVNTVVIHDGRLAGHNTDAAGFLAALTAAGFSPAGCSALVLGAGGAARSAVYALARAGARVTVWNRNSERAEALVQDLARHLPADGMAAIPSAKECLAEALAAANLLVNTTPIGMTGGPAGSPLPADLPLPRAITVFDLVYTPPSTPLLRRAAAAKARTISGLGMLVHQGAQAFALWTGHEPPVQVMERAARRALRRT